MQYKGYVVPLGNASIHKNDEVLFIMENNPPIWNLKSMEMTGRIPYRDVLLKDTSIVYINDRVSPVRKNMNNVKRLIENANTNEEYRKYGNWIFVDGFFFDDNIIIGGYGRYVTIWDMEGKLFSSIQVDGHPVFSLNLNNDRLLAAGYHGVYEESVHTDSLRFIPSWKKEALSSFPK